MICSWYSIICWICFIYVDKNVFAHYGDFLDSCVFDVCIDACTTHTQTSISSLARTWMTSTHCDKTYLQLLVCVLYVKMCYRSHFCCFLWPQRSTETKRKERKLEEGIAPVWSSCFFWNMFWLVVLEHFCGWVNHSSVFLVGGMSVQGKQPFLNDDISPDSLFVDAWNQPCRWGDSSLLPSCRWCARVFRGTGYTVPWKFT